MASKVQGKWKYVIVASWENEQQQLVANSDNLLAWETFATCTTERSLNGDFQYGSPFALRAHNDNIVTYDPERERGGKRLLAIYGHIKSSETFIFVNPHVKRNN